MAASTNGNASWEQLRGGERLQHAYRFCLEHRLNAGSLKNFPAPSGLDFAGMAEHYYLVCNSLVNELHQNLVLERFCKEAKRSRIECGLAHYWIVLSANKNNPRLR